MKSERNFGNIRIISVTKTLRFI